MRRGIALLAGLITLAAAPVATALPQQQGSVDLLNQANGQWVGPGEPQGGSTTGQSVVGLGPLFAGGRTAFAAGAPEADPQGRQGAGSVYVVNGQSGSATVDLTALTGRGFRVDGSEPGDELGFALSPLTLANGDPALAIGAPYHAVGSAVQAGIVYIIDLHQLKTNVNLAATRPNKALVSIIYGATECAEAGYALADIGPLGSGKGDALLIGAPGQTPSGCPPDTATGVTGGNVGAAYVVYPAHLPHVLRLAAPGSSASAFTGVAAGDRAGSAVAAAGSPGAFMIGAPDASPAMRTGAGAIYLLHGATPGRTVSLGSLPGGSTTFEGPAADAELGFSMTTTTGFPARSTPSSLDLVLGAPQASPKLRDEAGEIFVVPGARQPSVVDLAKPAASVGEIVGVSPGDEAGYALAGVGSLSGNGRADLAIGAPFVNSTTGTDRIDNGAVYVIYGGSGPAGEDLLHVDSRGFVAYGARNSDEAGTAISGALNESGDGRPDLLIGAPFAENFLSSTPTEGGAVYAVLGFGTPRIAYRRVRLIGTVGNALEADRPKLQTTGAPRFTITPRLPRGVTFNPRTGQIGGTPRVVSPLTYYSVQLTDEAGTAAATVSLAVAPRHR